MQPPVGRPIEGRAWLAQFGADLPLVHDDARGLLFFPDTSEPRGRAYDAVVAEIASAGVWIPAAPLTAEEAHAREVTSMAEGAMPGVDMEGLPAFAQQLFGSMNLGAAGAPGDMASMIATLQKQVMGALGMQGDEVEGEGLDEEAFDALVLLVKRTTPLDIGSDEEQDVNELVTLADGTAVIQTTAAMGEGEMVAVQLAEDHADWVSEHGDARGVPSFGARHLDAIRGAATYDAALAALGDAVVFLQPQSLE